jgi:putative hydrolase of HD superfamily
MESDAMGKIRVMLGDALGGAEVEALWHEYEDGTTDEAKLLKVGRSVCVCVCV